MTYRGVIVGFGGVAVEGHLPAWRRNRVFELAAVVDPSPERRNLARTLPPGVACYQRLDDCFACEKIDFVDICSPPVMHDAALLHACNQKVHILCEKPLTLSGEALFEKSTHSPLDNPAACVTYLACSRVRKPRDS